ncbi:MAG: hypothetical protein ABSG03_31460 [Bryobacteraceae bacterium]|jgi:hypothetical protein
MTKLLPSKPLTRETSLKTYDGVPEVTLPTGREGWRTTLYGSLEHGDQR